MHVFLLVGAVEVFHETSRVWSPVCSKGFGVAEALVVCTALHFPSQHGRVEAPIALVISNADAWLTNSDWNCVGSGGLAASLPSAPTLHSVRLWLHALAC